MLPIKARTKFAQTLTLTTECHLLITFANSLGQIRPYKTSGSNLFDTQMVFLTEFFKKLILKNISRRQKRMNNFPGGKELTKVVHTA